MLWLLVLLVAGMFVLMVKGAAVARNEQRALQKRFFAAWHQGARAVGLDTRQLTPGECRAQGAIGGVPLGARLTLYQTKNSAYYQSTVWSQNQGIPRSLSVERDTTLRSMGRLVDGDDVPIGDPAFDELVELASVDASVCAALGYRARAQLSRLLGWGVSVRDGTVACESAWTEEHNRSFTSLLRNTAALARELAVPADDLHERLAFNAIHDPARDVRLANLRFLLAPELETPPALAASVAASLLTDVHAPVRLLAAERLGQQGHPVLFSLAADPALDLPTRVRAVQSLGQPPVPDLPGLCHVIAASETVELVCAALDCIRPSSAAALDTVLESTQSPHESVRAAAARALGELSRPDTEPTLIALLGDPSSDVQRASADALGRFASVAAVEPLLPLSENLMRPQLRQAARGAIGRIQSRLGAVEAGRVSLAEPHELAGALDLADGTRAGELALAHEDDDANDRATPTPRRRWPQP
jgi:hypothetical protein